MTRWRWPAFAAIVFLVAANHVIFRQLGNDYVEWYLRNGAVIGLVTALFAVVWGEVDRNVALIAADPRAYAAACLTMVALPLITLGHQVTSVGQRLEGSARELGSAGRALLLNVVLMLPVLLALLALLAFWLLVIAPIQYFAFLLCGALPRALLHSTSRVIARTEGFSFETKLIPNDARVPDGWWDASFTRKPVALTATFSALLTFAIRAVVS